MNRQELLAEVAKKTGSTKAEADRFLSAVLDTIVGAAANNDNVTLMGFGTFSVTSRAARVGRNPKTGESIQIPASKNVSFKAGLPFREQINASTSGTGKK